VSVIQPGPIVTAFRRNAAHQATEQLDADVSRFGAHYEKEAARRKKQVKKVDLFNRPPEDVAARIAHALESSRPRRRYLVTIPAHAASLVSRFLPTEWIDRMLVSDLPEGRR
ncbi:MAG: short-chain dehydrogenase, partial [Verrucomicrobiota bacterium]